MRVFLWLQVAAASVVRTAFVVVVRFRRLGFLEPHQPFVFLQLGLVSEVAAAGPDNLFEVLLGHAGTLSRPISGVNSVYNFVYKKLEPHSHIP